MIADDQEREPGKLSVRVKPKVLVLDNDESTLIALERLLGDAGLDATTTWDQSEAISLLGRNSFDLLVIGQHPPEVNCGQVLRFAYQQNRTQPVIVLQTKAQVADSTSQGLPVLSKREYSAIVQRAHLLVSSTVEGSQHMQEKLLRLDPGRQSPALRDFTAALKARIVGQDSALQAVTEIYQMFLTGLNPPGRPVGNMLFLGPTGSGKTHVVEAMAEVLFGEPHACVKVDCAEFQHSHEISKLIGSPPGYIGHRETHPLLSQQALNRWHTEQLKLSLLLFDEVEKASDALWQLLLGILDKATLTLGDTTRVDMSASIIFMTSNLGAAEMTSLVHGSLGFAQTPAAVDTDIDNKITRIAQEAARRKFSPEFMNRIDKVVVFKTLDREQLEQILDLELALVQRRIAGAAGANPFVFNCTPRVKAFLLQQGTDQRYGARHLKRAIERLLVFPLANLVATGQVGVGDCVHIDVANDSELTFSKAASTDNRSAVARRAS